MIRLHITTEGQTEQAFVKEVLTPHFGMRNIYSDARCVMTSKDNRHAKIYRGGLLNYSKARADILSWITQDNHSECRFTTMFDLYALPQDFPGYGEAKKQADPYQQVQILETALSADIADFRFIPYIQLHEFEALILADPVKLDWEYLEHDKPIQNLMDMAKNQNPELINSDPQTAPSKRIRREIPEYDKVTAVSVVKKIGLNVLRGKCCHFNEWVTRLEQTAS